MKQDDTQKVIEKVTNLVELAQSDDEQEARTAAMQAARLMKKHELTVVPASELEQARKLIGEAKDLAMRVKAEGNKNMLLGAAIGWFLKG